MEDNELEKINLDNNKNDVAAFFAKGIAKVDLRLIYSKSI